MAELAKNLNPPPPLAPKQFCRVLGIRFKALQMKDSSLQKPARWIVLTGTLLAAVSCTHPSFELRLDEPGRPGDTGGVLLGLQGQPKFAKIHASSASSFSGRSLGWLSTTAEHEGRPTSLARVGAVLKFGEFGGNGPRGWIVADDQEFRGLRGAFDFFIRISKPLSAPDEIRVFDHGNPRKSGGGIRIVLKNQTAKDTQLAFEVINENVSVRLDHPPIRITPNQVYHVAATLVPIGNNRTRVSLYVEEGSGAIFPSKSIGVHETIVIDKDWVDVSKALTGDLTFGINNPRRAGANVQDFDRIRFYTGVPKVFPGLPR